MARYAKFFTHNNGIVYKRDQAAREATQINPREKCMGMFDTFQIQDQGRNLAVQSKQFANMLADYRLGDFVEYETTAPHGVQTYIEDHKQNWSDPACPTEWIVLLQIEGCFLSIIARPHGRARIESKATYRCDGRILSAQDKI